MIGLAAPPILVTPAIASPPRPTRKKGPELPTLATSPRGMHSIVNRLVAENQVIVIDVRLIRILSSLAVKVSVHLVQNVGVRFD